VLQLLCSRNYGKCNVTLHYECFSLLLSTFRGMFALSNMAVLCSSLFSCFPNMMLRYVLHDSDMVPAALIITGNTSVPHPYKPYFYCTVFIFYKPLCFFLITRVSPGIATSINSTFLFHYHGLCCLVYCSGWICRCSLVDYVLLLFLLLLLLLLLCFFN